MKRLLFLLLILVGYFVSLAQTYQVTFNYDMRNYLDFYAGAYLALEVKDTNGIYVKFATLNDDDNDSIFTAVVELSPGIYYYQATYIYGSYHKDEKFPKCVVINNDTVITSYFDYNHGFNLRLNVKDNYGIPLYYADVNVNSIDNNSYYGINDSIGSYVYYGLPENFYHIDVYSMTREYTYKKITAFLDKDTVIDIVLIRKVPVIIHLEDSLGTPLDYIRVSISNETAPSYSDVGTTDQNGNVLLYALPGNCIVNAYSGITEDFSTNIVVPESTDTSHYSFEVPLKPTLWVTLIVDDGVKPLSDIIIELISEGDGDCSVDYIKKTDENGKARFRLCNSDFSYWVYGRYEFLEDNGDVILNNSDTTIYVHLVSNFPFLLKVRNEDGEPVDDISITNPYYSNFYVNYVYNPSLGNHVYYLPEGQSNFYLEDDRIFTIYEDVDTSFEIHHYYDSATVVMPYKSNLKQVTFNLCIDTEVCTTSYLFLEDTSGYISERINQQQDNIYSTKVTPRYYNVRYGCVLKDQYAPQWSSSPYNLEKIQTVNINTDTNITLNELCNLKRVCQIKVQDTNGNVVPDATIWLDFLNKSLKTNNQGITTFNFADELSTNIKVESFWFEDYSFYVNLSTDTQLVITLNPLDTNLVRIKTINLIEQSLPGTKLIFDDTIVYTDSTGLIELPGPAHKIVRLVAETKGYLPVTQYVSYDDLSVWNDTTFVVFKQKGYKVIIKTTFNGQPVGNLPYELEDDDNNRFYYETDSNGVDTIYCNRAYFIFTANGDYFAKTRFLVNSDTTINISVFPKNIHLTILATDQYGNKLPGIAFSLYGVLYEPYMTYSFGDTTDSNGMVNLLVYPLKYKVKFRSPLLGEYKFKTIDIYKDTTIIFVFKRPSLKYFYVDDYVSPLDSANVLIYSDGFLIDLYTDDRGFASERINLAFAGIAVSYPGFFPVYTYTENNDFDTMRFSLTSMKSFNIDFWVTDSANAPISGAAIKLFNKKYYTDGSGHFYTKLTSGDFAVKTLKSGYAPLITFFSVHSDTTIHIMLGPGDYTDVTQTGDNLTVYPNPAHRYVFVANAQGMRLDIVDITGKTVVSERVNSDLQRVDVERLPAGVYLLRLENGNNVKTFKLIVR